MLSEALNDRNNRAKQQHVDAYMMMALPKKWEHSPLIKIDSSIRQTKSKIQRERTGRNENVGNNKILNISLCLVTINTEPCTRIEHPNQIRYELSVNVIIYEVNARNSHCLLHSWLCIRFIFIIFGFHLSSELPVGWFNAMIWFSVDYLYCIVSIRVIWEFDVNPNKWNTWAMLFEKLEEWGYFVFLGLLPDK